MENRKTSGARSALRASSLAGRPGAAGTRHRLKTIGLALFAALSLLAIGAASAQAAAPEFHAQSEPVIFEGEQVQKLILTTTGGTLACKTTILEGTSGSKTSSTMTLVPGFESCTAFGRAATLDTNGCEFQLHLVAGTEPPTATADIIDCAGGGMTLTVPSLPCTVTIPQQTGLGHLTFENKGVGVSREILATIALTGVKYTESGAGCLGSGVGTLHTNGTWSGTATIRGYQDEGGLRGAQQGIWSGTVLPAPYFHAEKAPTLIEGEQRTKIVFSLTTVDVASCKAATFAGTSSTTTSSTMTLTPSFSGCHGFIGWTFDTNGCKFELHLVLESSPSTATVDLDKCSGKGMALTSGNCIVSIPEQTSIGHVLFNNEGTAASRDILATLALSKIKYTESVGCFGTEIGVQHETGTMTGTVTLKGFEDTGGIKGSQMGLWVE